VNGNAVKGLPHFQIVRLIITAASPIRLTLKPGSERSSQRRLQSEALPSTPLRNQQRQGPYARCPPLSSTPVQLPGYWDTCTQPIAAQAQQSPSIIPLHTMTLASSPPPPYTAEPLTEHRVLERGAEVRSTACSGEHIGVLARSMPLEVDENVENSAESLVMQDKTLASRSQSSNDLMHLNSTHLGEPYTSYNALGNDSHLGDINIRRALSFNDIIDDPVEGSVNTELPTQSQPRAGSILDEIKNFNRQENRAESLVMQDKTLASRSQSSNYLMHLNSTHLGEPYTSYNALGNDSHLGDINIRRALSFNDIIDDPVEGSVNTELPTQSQPRAGSILDEIKNFNRQENRAESLVMQDKTLASRSQSSNYLMHLNSTHLGEPYTSYNALGNDSHLGDINIRRALSFNDIIDDPVEGSVNTELPTQSQPRAGSILDEIKNFNRQ
ncbi:predicted protein, partial [Nematostella vectensis]